MGDRLRSLRKSRGLVQAVAAEAVGISRNHLTEIENGKDPGFQTFCALADFYGVSMDYLYRGTTLVAIENPEDVAHGPEESRLLRIWRGVDDCHRQRMMDGLLAELLAKSKSSAA
ncbi:hypothetical protein AA103196_3127 [Ameyamaea chiangmaiensis NBRC 103196]|uniref:Helix-turn-helix transcriptional regulator n=2 Tax=Ameyamaea chiangmaiensis TaxID=442969 RepID=A0A850P609_9PROT|nr:helix-turn-helix transcriptional regulator [Ameyamaea chiangmaiensis]MBS4074612.1 helix-turn-helix transcriptional regulator [Ameyamaea chiangmaiensis]NVN39368.1 helix-turn-helix transcriptional regulator [Ameyamaea chiangmaiensis]GBQ72664.1 hypothetical protein AA103196_3127 [Ameyamaea chiangmaiensis NBRC 103196]